MRRIVVLMVSVLALALPSAAYAGTVALRVKSYRLIDIGELTYRAAPGERNDVTISVDGMSATLTDKAGVKAGPGCRAVGSAATCTMAVTEERFGGFSSAELRLGDRNDLARAFTRIETVIVEGGSGNDRLSAGGQDTLYTRFVGGPGRDVMHGEGYRNLFDEGSRANGADVMNARSGWVDYGARKHPVRVELDGKANDGERGEHDRLGPRIDSARGGRAPDRLIGDKRANDLVGGGGTDVLIGGAGNDALVAAQIAAPWSLVDADGRDTLVGGPGEDYLYGSTGANRLSPGAGPDQIWTAGGADRVSARDGDVDEIHCKGGRERVTLDPIDFWRGCTGVGEGGGPVALSLDAEIADRDPEPYRAFVSVACSGPAAVSCSGVVQVLLDGREIGRATYSVDLALNDSATASVSLPEADYPLVESRDPRVSLVVTRDTTTQRFSAGVTHIGDGRRPTVPRLPVPF